MYRPGPGRSLGDQMGHHHHNHITSSKNKSSTAPELSFEPVCDNTNGNVGSTTQTKLGTIKVVGCQSRWIS